MWSQRPLGAIDSFFAMLMLKGGHRVPLDKGIFVSVAGRQPGGVIYEVYLLG